MDQRMSKDKYYLNIADAVLDRSTCLRRKYGAIIVKNDEILSTGYNGAPRGRVNCSELGYCNREQLHRLRRREAADELLLPVETAVVFRARLDVRVIVQHGHAKIPREVLEHVAAARAAAALKQQARLALRREGSEQRIELFLIVFFHKRHLPDSIAHPRAEYQCGP